MCRSKNIKTLGLTCFKLAGDSTLVSFARTKSAKDGVKVNQKHVYSNPIEPEIDINLALGAYLASNPELGGTFIYPGGASAANTYNTRIAELLATPAGKAAVGQYGGMCIDVLPESILICVLIILEICYQNRC